MTLSSTFSTLCTGLHRSDADSYMFGSSPGACRIEMHTFPSAYTARAPADQRLGRTRTHTPYGGERGCLGAPFGWKSGGSNFILNGDSG